MRPTAPQDRAGLLLAAMVFGLTVLLVPVRGEPAHAAAPERPTPVLLAAAPPHLPVQAPQTPPTGPEQTGPEQTAKPNAPTRAAKPAPTGPVKKQLKVKIKAKPEVLAELRPGKSGRRTVALTFDDGPDPVWTPQVLALLRQYRAVATFCMIGEKVRAHPELVTKVVNAGHRLCDHSRTHPVSLAALDEGAQRDEILDAREDLAEATKATVPYFRAPGGNWSPEVTKLAAKKKMQPLGWTVDPRDWSLPGTPVIVTRVQRGMAPGAIVLMHDGGGPRQQTVDALTTLLPWLVEHGYRFTFPTP